MKEILESMDFKDILRMYRKKMGNRWNDYIIKTNGREHSVIEYSNSVFYIGRTGLYKKFPHWSTKTNRWEDGVKRK